MMKEIKYIVGILLMTFCCSWFTLGEGEISKESLKMSLAFTVVILLYFFVPVLLFIAIINMPKL